MNTPTKVAGFALGLLAVFAAATGLGALIGPVGAAEAAHTGGSAGAGHSSTVPAAEASRGHGSSPGHDDSPGALGHN